MLANISTPDSLKIEGINFWPIIKGESKEKERTLYWRLNNAYAFRKGDWKLIHKGNNIEEENFELYNLKNDPYETSDQAQMNSQKLLELKSDLENQIKLDISKKFK